MRIIYHSRSLSLDPAADLSMANFDRNGSPLGPVRYFLMDPGGVPLSIAGPLCSDLDEHSRVASASADSGGQPLALECSLRLGISLSIAISRSHQCGLIHKDIKPANAASSAICDACLAEWEARGLSRASFGLCSARTIPRLRDRLPVHELSASLCFV